VAAAILDQTILPDIKRSQLVTDQMRFLVLAHDSYQLDVAAKRARIVRHIRRSPDPMMFVLEPNDRDRRFRRDAIDAADDELVEHDVAEDHEGCAGKASDDLASSGRREKLRQGRFVLRRRAA
jgi:hypothetical protein